MSWQVAGCCTPCWGGMGVGGCKGKAGRQGLARWRAVTGRQGVACRIGATWQVGSDGVLVWQGMAGRQGLVRRHAMTGRWGLARHVGATWRVGSGGVLAWWVGWRGVGAGTNGGGMACNVQGLACCVGVARQVGGGGVLGRGQMEVASMHQRGAMTCNVQVCHVLIMSEDGRGAWKGESGEAGRGVEVGAQAGGLRPLPPPCAREPPPFVPTPTCRSDMARNTPPPPTC
ncbi:hypothetical protein EDB89DRAFT_2240727 [Lactarius sanguifluus]|nr:hypothetical protein EDB89DRAFT_2240727 [Lactarius sanguifluus]